MAPKVICKETQKRRYPDLGQARLGAKGVLAQKGIDHLAVYECARCRGYHLTRYTGITAKHIVAREYLPEIAQWEVMKIIGTGPVTSNPKAGSRDEKWIHAMCAKLESKGLVIRTHDTPDVVQWEVNNDNET